MSPDNKEVLHLEELKEIILDKYSPKEDYPAYRAWFYWQYYSKYQRQLFFAHIIGRL